MESPWEFACTFYTGPFIKAIVQANNNNALQPFFSVEQRETAWGGKKRIHNAEQSMMLFTSLCSDCKKTRNRTLLIF